MAPSLFPSYLGRPYMRMLKWINGNSIMHSRSLHWLLFKVPQCTRKTCSIIFGIRCFHSKWAKSQLSYRNQNNDTNLRKYLITGFSFILHWSSQRHIPFLISFLFASVKDKLSDTEIQKMIAKEKKEMDEMQNKYSAKLKQHPVSKFSKNKWLLFPYS